MTPVDQIATLTPAEQAEFARLLADLHEHGYRDIDQHGQIRPGARIRHRGQRYSEAYTHGTGFVLALTQSPRTIQGMPDVEMIVLYDKPRLSDSRLTQLAQYHVDVIEVAS